MFGLFKPKPVQSPDDLCFASLNAPLELLEVLFHRIEAVNSLALKGHEAVGAMPALVRLLVMPVSLDWYMALRVAVAEAVWKIGRRRDLALPFLTWALKDEFWHIALSAVKILADIGDHSATPDLIEFANRSATCGPSRFESYDRICESAPKSKSLLAEIIVALGKCGRGLPYGKQAHEALTQFAMSGDAETREAATRALELIAT